MHNCPNDGNYFCCIDLLAEFGPFLADYIQMRDNPGKGNVFYLSSNICDEFIDLLTSKVLKTIVYETKTAKYCGIGIYSAADISHTDQLTVIFHYVTIDGNVFERFLQFIPIQQHDRKYLFDVLRSDVESHGINIADCRSQSYDNASNMSDIYSGVQEIFPEVICLAEWVPCSVHSLNLFGSSAAECCTKAVDFLGILQSLFAYFSVSQQRWTTLKKNRKKNAHVIQSMSETRWSA